MPKAKKDLTTVKGQLTSINSDLVLACPSMRSKLTLVWNWNRLNCELLCCREVGKVSWCKPEANKIMLIPVPKYPFVFKKSMNEESAKQVDTSSYAEDSSLKADYFSLVDIRIVEQKKSKGFEAAATKISEASGTKKS